MTDEIPFRFRLHDELWLAFDAKESRLIEYGGLNHVISYVDSIDLQVLCARAVIAGVTWETQNLRWPGRNTEMIYAHPETRLSWGMRLENGTLHEWLWKITSEDMEQIRYYIESDISVRPNVTEHYRRDINPPQATFTLGV